MSVKYPGNNPLSLGTMSLCPVEPAALCLCVDRKSERKKRGGWKGRWPGGTGWQPARR